MSELQSRIEALLDRIAAIRFEHPDCPKGTNGGVLHEGIVAAGALGDTARTRTLIARIHKLLVRIKKDTLLWNMALREASSFAAEGNLAQALAGVELWRGSVEATQGKMESRVSGTCIAGGAYRAAIRYCDLANDIKGTNRFLDIDKALLEARYGSLALAQNSIAALEAEPLTDNIKQFLPVIKGVVACRENEIAAADLLTTSVMEMVAGAEKSPAAWSLFGTCCWWWAIALHRCGKQAEAQRLIKLITPLMVYRFDYPLIVALDECGLLPSGTPMSVIPDPPPPNEMIEIPALESSSHSVFNSVYVRGVNALKAVEQYRRKFADGSGLYPFLIGDAADLAGFKDMIDPPPDGGANHIAMAQALDVKAWFTEKGVKAGTRWPKESAPQVNGPETLYDHSGMLKPEMHIGLIEVNAPEEVFARLGYGKQNDNPAPHIHMALHAHWRKQYQAEPIAISGSAVECVVGTPCEETKAALRLASEHYAYCYDIVEQGVGTKALLATSLMASGYWYFWWD